MKKLLSIFLAIVTVLTCSVFAFAADGASGALRFGTDGKFKIMMINDTQDVGKNARSETAKFIGMALDQEHPDLVVFVGDQLSDIYPKASKEFLLSLCAVLRGLL